MFQPKLDRTANASILHKCEAHRLFLKMQTNSRSTLGSKVRNCCRFLLWTI